MSPERLEKFEEIERREKELHDSFGVVDSEWKLAAKISALVKIHKDVWGDKLKLDELGLGGFELDEPNLGKLQELREHLS